MKVIRLVPESQDRRTQSSLRKITSPILGPTTIQTVPTASFFKNPPNIFSADVIVIHIDGNAMEQCRNAVNSIRKSKYGEPVVGVLAETHLECLEELLSLEFDDIVIGNVNFSNDIQLRCQINLGLQRKRIDRDTTDNRNESNHSNRTGIPSVESDKATVPEDVTDPYTANSQITDQSPTINQVTEQMQLVAHRIGLGTWRWEVERDQFLLSKEYANANTSTSQNNFSSWLENVDARDQQAVATEFNKAVSGPLTRTNSKQPIGSDEIQTPLRYRMSDGQLRWIMLVGKIRRNRDGRAIKFNGVFIDITQQKSAEQELHRLNISLKNSNEELSHFAYAASHDLQEPLRKIVSFGQMLELECKDELGDDGKMYLAYMTDGARRMGTLINDLLNFCRIQTEAQELQTVDLNHAANSAIFNLSASIEESNAQVFVEPLPSVKAEGIRMVQLLQNLIGNAIKYQSNSAPVIRVSSRSDCHGDIVTVSDNGIGVAPEHRERIFGVFKRLHNAQEFPGTGVGLAICKRIVDRAGGRIWVESNEPSGSKFSFSLPAE